MDLHHNIMFCGPKRALKEDTGCDNTCAAFFHRFQKRIMYPCDKFHFYVTFDYTLVGETAYMPGYAVPSEPLYHYISYR